MEMKKSIILKYALEEEDDGVDKIGEDSSIIGGLSGEVLTNQSFTDTSLATIKPMPLQGNGLTRKPCIHAEGYNCPTCISPQDKTSHQ